MDNNINELIDKYKLSKEEHDRVLEILKEYLFTDKIVSDKPSVMLVIGQPGSGKTTFINNTDLSKYIIINSDNYRSYNKYSEEILDKYPTNYAKLTNYDAHLWGDELFTYAIQNGYSVLREKAPTDYSLLETIKSIPDNYEVIVNVMAVGDLTSILATRKRYEEELLSKKSAKLSNFESHNKCYELLPFIVDECLSLKIKLNYILPIDNRFEIISINDNNSNLLDKFRRESNDKTLVKSETMLNSIKESMTKRKAAKEEFDELEKINIIIDNLK